MTDRHRRDDGPCSWCSWWSRVALTGVSAGLLAASIQRESLAIVGVIALVPWLIAIVRARMGEAAILGALLGILYGVGLASWIPSALQTLRSPVSTSWAGLFVVCAWVGAPIFLTIALIARASVNYSTAVRVMLLSAAWFGGERLLSEAWWGVPWGLLGASQLGVLGVAQLAAVGGVPLISAWLLGIQVAIADRLLGRTDALRIAAALIASWLALVVAGLPMAQGIRPNLGSEASFDVLFIQPNLPRGERWAPELQALNLYRVRSYTDRAMIAERPGLSAIVLPENLLTTPVDTTPDLAAATNEWVAGLGIPVLTGIVLSAAKPNAGLYRSAAVWLTPGRGMTARIDKEHAIPLLESGRRFPFERLVTWAFAGAADGPKVEEVPAGSPLRGPVSLTPVLCYEVLFPDLVARRRTPDSVAIVNLADDSWVEGEQATRHLLNLARFRAIEQRLPLVRLAHGGLSAVVDEFGRVTQELPRHTYASLRIGLHAMPPPAYQERVAILALPVSAFSVVWWGWALRMRKGSRPTGEVS